MSGISGTKRRYVHYWNFRLIWWNGKRSIHFLSTNDLNLTNNQQESDLWIGLTPQTRMHCGSTLGFPFRSPIGSRQNGKEVEICAPRQSIQKLQRATEMRDRRAGGSDQSQIGGVPLRTRSQIRSWNHKGRATRSYRGTKRSPLQIQCISGLGVDDAGE